MYTLVCPASPRLRLLAITLLVLATASACDRPPTGSTTQPAARTLVVGTEPTFPPFEARGEKGDFVGFDIDLVRAIGAKAGFNVQFKDLGFDALIPALNAGQIDVIASAMSITDERKNAVDFSDPYVEAGLVIAVRQNEQGVRNAETLVGKTLAVQQGSTGAEAADKLKAAGKVKEIKYFQTVPLAMMELTKGGADAVINDRPTAENYVASNPNQVRVLPEPVQSDSYGLAIKKGNADLLAKINTALKELKAEGFLKQLEDKHFAGKTVAGTSAEAPKGFSGHMVAVLPDLVKGAGIAVLVVLIAEVMGTVLGLGLALMRLSGSGVLSVVAAVYVDLIRGTPMLVQILFVYFGVPSLISSLTGSPFNPDPIIAGTLALGFNSAAYVSEIYRATLGSIDRGQNEAACALGLSPVQRFRYVIFPQAFRIAIPPLGNEFVTLLKDTSLLSVIAVMEIVKAGQLYMSRTYAVFPTYLAIALVYVILTLAITNILRVVERRMKLPT
ncbi:ABC transporter permease subunit [Humisphaera borealis]|uniref:Putative glutamine transport system permease protein GlnP n=1 Tax=Humisphaera borealis TaxID=2807512 RepID=A0A7M2WYJ0_9BACT|nr:ABC transporter permease subunit [Humisphaera borealis]QOV90489.1 ABC transporter permease subunit [Humisphaera borealis]